jgi:hypothetical protein
LTAKDITAIFVCLGIYKDFKLKLQQIMIDFKQAYNRASFLHFLETGFLPEDFEREEEPISFEADYTRQVTRLGECNSLGLVVFEVLHTSTHDARVALSKEAFRLLLNRSTKNKALVLFVPVDRPENYRFSLVTIDVVLDEHKVRKSFSNPRRYSYLLGEDAKVLTPTKFLLKPNDKVKDRRVKDFKDLQARFSVEVLTKEFYNELFAWYQWALSDEIGVTYPNDRSTDTDDRKIEEHLIRLITRLMFVWFIKQKKLVPDALFEVEQLKLLLKNFEATNSKQDNYYRAILQNLFFATLNNKIEDREFAADGNWQENRVQFGIKTLFRYISDFSVPKEQVIQQFNQVPFLNGGLFECLDKDTPDSNGKIVYSDGFSRKPGKQSRAFVPNILFFDEAKGIISILNKYNFTIEENSPLDVEVALDPELLGKVFENLLGTYNPETKETARKQSGSFYTPREIVQYMVDESLVAHLKRTVGEELEDEYRKLISQTDEPTTLTNEQKNRIFVALKSCKILDPACGSGAFPMGILNRMLAVIQKLVPANNSLYDLKLYLIENCIYGIDIQSIAVQISKLRFFISLICEQKPTADSSDNYGIKPLPNLETKFVAANTLIGLTQKDAQGNLFEDTQIEVTRTELMQTRHRHFLANTSKQKDECRKEDKRLREKLADLLKENKDYAPEDAHQLANWNPYDQNASSPFFDTEWMFGIKDGFDVVIGNPPYVQLQKNKEIATKLETQKYKTFARTGDIYMLFIEQGNRLLKERGNLIFITNSAWLRTAFGEKLKTFFANDTSLKKVIDLSDCDLFENAAVLTTIIHIQKGRSGLELAKGIRIRKTEQNIINSLSSFFEENSVPINSYSPQSAWTILEKEKFQIKTKVENQGIAIKNWEISINYGIKTGLNEAFVIDGSKKAELIATDPKSKEIIKPLLRGRDVTKYQIDFADLWLVNIHNGVKEKGIPAIDAISEYPAIYSFLEGFGDIIKTRSDQGNHWSNLRNCAYIHVFERPKIIFPNMTKHMPFYYDDSGYYTNQKCFIITGSHLKYLTAILNSTLFEYCFRSNFPELLGGVVELGKVFFERIPIKIPELATEKDFEPLVDRILSAKKADPKADTSALEQEIDRLVYELYGLTEEEIAVVENKK